MRQIEIGELENLYEQYETWCRANSLVAEFGPAFFDWMNDEEQ